MSYKWPKVKQRDTSCDPVRFPPIKEPLNGGKDRNVSSELAAKGKQITCSFRHRKFPDGDYHSGGPFFTAYNRPRTPTRNVKLKDAKHFLDPWYTYQGPIVQPLNFGSGMGSGSFLFNQDDSHLDKYGAEAIHIVDPTNPNAEFGVALGEILLDRRISLPVIQSWKRRTELVKAAGSEYLSYQFGWRPLVEDIKNTIQSIRDAHLIMENYHSLDGHEVHREFEFEPITSDKVETVNSSARCEYSTNTNIPEFNYLTPAAIQSRHTKTTTRRWFSGTFVHYPNRAYNSLLGRRFVQGGDSDKLFGSDLTPDVLWELAPWSWAVDWFSNVGEVVNNFTAFELHGLVMKYGFIMEEKSIEEVLFMPHTGLAGVSGPPPNIYNTGCVKRRREANPFGFGVGWEGLSPTQLAITAALGITRLR